MIALTDALRDQLVANLQSFPVLRADTTARQAAVALTITHGDTPDDGAALLLTRRASKMSTHPGQWALPGGRVDDGETAEEAARRELLEELGVDLGPEACLGRLDDYTTRSGTVIQPFVYWIGGRPALVPNPAEVASIHRIPVAEFDYPGSPELLDGPDEGRPIIRVYLNGRRIHAPTGAVLHQFWEVAVNGRWTRVAHFDQPSWAY